jgi:hypothetical protein
MQPEKTGKSPLFERVASKRLPPLKKRVDGCEAVGGGISPAASPDHNAAIGIVSANCATFRMLHRLHASAVASAMDTRFVAVLRPSGRTRRGLHADTRSPLPHVVLGHRRSPQDPQSSARRAGCDASNVQTAAIDQLRSPASLGRSVRVGATHSFPIDRDARCRVRPAVVALCVHARRGREQHRWIRRAVHRDAIRLVAVTALRGADQCVRAEGQRSSRDSAGSRRDGSGSGLRDRRPSRRA